MPLTPADVHNVAFSKPPIGKRGYNEDEVDAFLDLVETEKRQGRRVPREQVSGFEPTEAAAPAPAAGGVKGRRPSRKDKLRAGM